MSKNVKKENDEGEGKKRQYNPLPQELYRFIYQKVKSQVKSNIVI